MPKPPPPLRGVAGRHVGPAARRFVPFRGAGLEIDAPLGVEHQPTGLARPADGRFIDPEPGGELAVVAGHCAALLPVPGVVLLFRVPGTAVNRAVTGVFRVFRVFRVVARAGEYRCARVKKIKCACVYSRAPVRV